MSRQDHAKTESSGKTNSATKKGLTPTSTPESSLSDSAGLEFPILNQVGSTDPAMRLMLQRMPPAQRQKVTRDLTNRFGNRYAQRLVTEEDQAKEDKPEAKSSGIHIQSTGNSHKHVVQRTLHDDVSGQWTEGLATLTTMYTGAGGVIDRQKDAVRQFCELSRITDPPSISEQVMVGAINMLLGAALGGIGTVLKSIAGRMLQPALLAATRATMGTAVDSADVRSTMRVSTDAIIDKIMDAGKERVSSAVSEAWASSGGSQETAILQYKETQLQALNSIGQVQARAIIAELARLRATEGEADEWAAADALYGAFQQALTEAYTYQFNKVSDTWFNMQVQTIGLGVRPGVLRVYLDRRYPHEGSFRITGGNLRGSGSNEEIRARLARRSLQEIEIPKVIRMNGKMGWGIMDCDWYIEVSGAEAQSSGPAISAPRSRLESLTAGPQDIQGYGGNRWGFPWLAAYHLGLDDLERDDERNTAANQSAGARAVWDAIKNMTVGSIGDSSWS